MCVNAQVSTVMKVSVSGTWCRSFVYTYWSFRETYAASVSSSYLPGGHSNLISKSVL